MATLSDMKTITSVLMLELSGDGWTVDLLATATPYQLKNYKGVGYATAKKIIVEAQELVNKAGLEEAIELEPPPPPEGSPAWTEPEEVQESVRVKRAKKSAQ